MFAFGRRRKTLFFSWRLRIVFSLHLSVCKNCLNIRWKITEGISLADTESREMVWSVPTTAVTKIELVFKQSPNMDGTYFRMPASVADLKIHYSAMNWVKTSIFDPRIFLCYGFKKKLHFGFLWDPKISFSDFLLILLPRRVVLQLDSGSQKEGRS